MPKKRTSETFNRAEATETKIETVAPAPEKKASAPRTRSHAVRSQKSKPEPSVLKPATPSSYEGLQQEVAKLAYFFWEERGCPSEGSVDDWLKAEKQLQSA